MRVPVEWLTEYADPGLPVSELEERLTMTGTKVEAVHHHGVDALERFVIGRVLEAGRHPDADRLSVCMVDVGDGGPQQIVCGAPNVAAGQIVAVARPGAVMPDGTKLGVAKLRGVESNGMILAEDELAIGTEHAGIMVLDAELEPGTPLSGVLPIATEVLELEVTPNRPDCLAVYGVAREVHAATGAPLAAPPWDEEPAAGRGEIAGVEVVVEAPDLCPRFTARAFEDVTIGPSPPWLKARLMAAGQRPINNVVDITNYVMLLVGSPIHAFDLDRVAGGRLVVRRAKDGEQVTTLDGQVRTLDAQMLVIDDADGPTSIAGVMGGERSEVHEGTTRVLMEAANWDGPNIHRTSQAAGPAQRGQRALREGPRARAGAAGRDRRHPAHARADRRAPRARDDRRRRRRSAARGHPPARAPRRRRSSACRSRARARPRSCARWSSASRRRPAASRCWCPPSGATTSRARPTSSRRSPAWTASRSCPPRCPSAAAAPGA